MRRPNLESLARFLWALVLVTLPVTSFRYLPFMGAGTTVRPLALYPLGLLLLILFYQLWTRRITLNWNRSLTILLAFTLMALLSTAFGALLAPIELRGQGYLDRALRAWITLVIGLSFFIAAVWMNRNEEDIKFSLKWLLAGMVLHMAWGGVQAVGLRMKLRPELNEIQRVFSIRGLVKNKRISGFAYEPSWLAGQLATMYLPWLFASLMARYHLSRFKWLEPLLLFGGLLTLLLTYSRGGLVVVVDAGIVTFMVAGSGTLKGVWAWYRAGFRLVGIKSRWGRIQAAGSRIAVSLIALSAFAGAVFFLKDKGYISAFWESSAESFSAYITDVYLGPRVAYAIAALDSYQSHPFTGVGLGASGFGMYANMPDWSLSGIPEISEQLSPSSSLYPNPKNLYVRLLAETGSPGFILFVSFLFTMLAYALTGLRRAEPFMRFMGTAGIFTVTAIALQTLSQDSFAMPEMWINLGILAGSTVFAIKSVNKFTNR